MFRTLKDYAEAAGEGIIGELETIAAHLKDLNLQIVSATPVSEFLSTMFPLLEELGVRAEWDVIKGGEALGRVMRALDEGADKITGEMEAVYREAMEWNRRQIPVTGDVVLVCGVEAAGFIGDYHAGWLWKCETDLTERPSAAGDFLRPYFEQYDGAIFHAPECAPPVGVPAFVIPPAIDPLNERNKAIDGSEVAAFLERHGLDPTRPFLAHVAGSVDRGVVTAYRIVKRRCDCQLLLAGPPPEELGDPDIHFIELPPLGGRELNALVRVSSLVFHHSTGDRADAGVSEVLWKSAPVIADTGGVVRQQIIDGVTGCLVHSPEGAAMKALELLNDPARARRMGEDGREQVRRRALIPHEIRDHLLAMLAVAYPTGDMVT